MGRLILIAVGIVGAVAGGILLKRGISSPTEPCLLTMPGLNGRRGRSRRRSRPQAEPAEVDNGQPLEASQSY